MARRRQQRRGLSERREFKLDEELAVLLRDAAAREDRSESAIIRRALRVYLSTPAHFSDLEVRS